MQRGGGGDTADAAADNRYAQGVGVHGKAHRIGSLPTSACRPQVQLVKASLRRRGHRKAATRVACSAMMRALLSSSVPAGSPLTSTVGLDHTATRWQPPQSPL